MGISVPTFSRFALVAGILAAFAADPDGAFTVADVAMRAYGVELRQVTKVHRVAVLRAMRRVREVEARFGLENGEGPQGQMVIFDRTRVLSYGLGMLKADGGSYYQWSWDRRTDTEEKLRARLAEPGDIFNGFVSPGGVWWRHVQEAIAEVNGDHEAVARMAAEAEARSAAFLNGFRESAAAGAFGNFGRRRRRDPDPVKPDEPDPAWDDDPAWQSLWGAAKGRRQKRDIVRRRVRAAGGVVHRWHLEMPVELFGDDRARWLDRWLWPESLGFRGTQWKRLATVSSASTCSQRKHHEPGVRAGGVAA
jgi:hypothetical protein